MKIIKVIATLLVFCLLFGCGYEPIYSKKKLNKQYDFSINSIGFDGENKVNLVLKNNLKNYLDNKEKKVKFDLIITSIVEKTVSSKNQKGDPEIFAMKITVNLTVFENNNIKNKSTFEESFEYKNKSNKFELNKYESNIQDDLASKLSNNIIKVLLALK